MGIYDAGQAHIGATNHRRAIFYGTEDAFVIELPGFLSALKPEVVRYDSQEAGVLPDHLPNIRVEHGFVADTDTGQRFR